MKIRNKFLNKSHAVRVIYPPGFSKIAFDEVNSILNHLWAAKAFKGKLLQLKNEIRIKSIYLYAITELLLRSKCLSDVQLIILSERAIGIKAFERACRSIDWPQYINNTMAIKIKIDSVASQAFHENALKDVLKDILNPYIAKIVTDTEENETTCIIVNLYKDKLTISLSLAGDFLYKRAYRGTLNASAPLREDFAACCIRNMVKFSHEYNKMQALENVIIPFSGTGTFAFEYFLYAHHISPLIFERHYTIQKMPFFKMEYYNNIFKKSLENVINTNTKIICIDHAIQANAAFNNNLERFNNVLIRNRLLPLAVECHKDDFFDLSFKNISCSPHSTHFMLLNPPYGIRLGKSMDAVNLYKKIAKKINEIAHILKKNQSNIVGLVLCPNEETWSVFIKQLLHVKTETYHFNQGGIDIRVCQFII